MKSEKEIQQKLDEIMTDERLYYKSATIFSNAPLALIQLSLEVKLEILSWVLEQPVPKIERI
jgi:hypothetical protein